MTDTSETHPNTATEPPPPPEAPETPQGIRHARFSDLVLEYKFWSNPRSQTGLSDAEIEELAASIRDGTTYEGSDAEGDNVRVHAGVRVPLEVVMIKGPNGAVVQLVIDGQRRYRGVEVAKLPPDALLPVFDLEPEPVEWTRELAHHYLLRALDAVGTRAGLSSYELAENAARLRGNRDSDTGKEYTLEKIARAVHRSASWVSKMLAARDSASPKLLLSWRTGEITDEQFKDLAVSKNPGKQDADAEAVVAARRSGDKAGARTLAKEQKLLAKPPQPKPDAKPAKADAKASKASKQDPPKPPPRGAQGSLPGVAPARKPPSFAVVEDFLSLAKRKPPTHDYVRGLMHGAAWASGVMDAAEFAKPWGAYERHVQGAKPSDKKDDKGKGKGKNKKRR